jgi:hypothetical protein
MYIILAPSWHGFKCYKSYLIGDILDYLSLDWLKV